MKVAIIGTGNMGAGLATELAAANYEVVIGSRNPAKAAALAEKLGSNVQGGGIAAALKLADIAFLALHRLLAQNRFSYHTVLLDRLSMISSC